MPIAWKERISVFIDAEGLEAIFKIVRGEPRGDAKLKTQVFPTFAETIGAFNALMRAIGVGKKSFISDTTLLQAFTGAIEEAALSGLITPEAARSIVLDARGRVKSEMEGAEFSASG